MDNVQLVTITPSMAQKWLNTMGRNRTLKQALLKRIVADIQNDRWRITGEPIIFDNYGKLIDGQHRLQGCVLAKKSIKCYVIKGGIDEDALTHIDTGASRTPGDVLTIKGQTEGNNLAATCRWIYRYENDDMALGLLPYSREDLIERIEKDIKGLRYSMMYGKKTGKFLSPSLTTALHYLMAKKDPILADQFFLDIADGIGADKNDPGYLLRECLIRNKFRQSRFPQHHMAALWIKAWNAIRSGRRTLKRLVWYPTGGTAEGYPKII